MTSDLIKPAELLKKFRMKTFDASNEARKHAINVMGPLTCKRGCSNCCHQKVLASPVEGLAIFLYLRSVGRWTPSLIARLTEENIYATKTSHDEWFKERHACPFLKDNECSVYQVRPVGCLVTFSVGGDPDLCAGKGAPGTGQFQVNMLGVGSLENIAAYFPALFDLSSFAASVDLGIPGSGFQTLSGSILFAAAFVQRRRLPRILTLSLDLAGQNLIEKFDEAGKTFYKEDQDG